ncbi:MAG: hypothetical protein HQL96_15190 [Magnetococcales bacterium]|nr:hypothetical protein [Magnetococcales bacterium]
MPGMWIDKRKDPEKETPQVLTSRRVVWARWIGAPPPINRRIFHARDNTPAATPERAIERKPPETREWQETSVALLNQFLARKQASRPKTVLPARREAQSDPVYLLPYREAEPETPLLPDARETAWQELLMPLPDETLPSD